VSSDEKRLAHVVRVVGAIGGDVAYDRVTPESLKANLAILAKLVAEWRQELERRAS
jgi:hypothetical protein